MAERAAVARAERRRRWRGQGRRRRGWRRRWRWPRRDRIVAHVAHVLDHLSEARNGTRAPGSIRVADDRPRPWARALTWSVSAEAAAQAGRELHVARRERRERRRALTGMEMTGIADLSSPSLASFVGVRGRYHDERRPRRLLGLVALATNRTAPDGTRIFRRRLAGPSRHSACYPRRASAADGSCRCNATVR